MYVTTFYSYKGGVGRTLALLNVAFELAETGFRVLVVDFDLEAPSIHPRRWERTKPSTAIGGAEIDWSNPGVVELIGEYLESNRVPRVQQYIVDATPKECNGKIDLMPSGVLDEDYGHRLNMIDWNDLYKAHDGYVMFEDVRAQLEQTGYDHVLLDSRTGFTDVGGICTRHLPDAVVTLFRADDQSLRGMEGIVESIRAEKPTPRRKIPIQLHFVLAAIPDADDEDGVLENRRDVFQRRLEILPGRLLEIRQYQSMDLLTQPIYTDIRPRTRLAHSFQRLTRWIRAFNIDDRDGILGYFQGDTVGLAPGNEEDFQKRIKEQYDHDPEVLARLAGKYGSQGSILEEADLLERVAEIGAVSSAHWLTLAHARRLTRGTDAALDSLKRFFNQPSESTQGKDRVQCAHIRRALSILQVAGVDRVSYVQDSPLIQGLSPQERARVAVDLDLSLDERRIAVAMLKDVLKKDDGAHEERANWERSLARARMAIGDFTPSLATFWSRLLESGTLPQMPTAFNMAMALWAERGAPDEDAFIQVLESYDTLEDNEQRRDPSILQALAVAEWFGERPQKAAQNLQRAENVINGQMSEISCWSYLRVSRETFLDDCDQIRRLFAGEDVRPAFMQVDKKKVAG